jgi:hypothetical protein
VLSSAIVCESVCPLDEIFPVLERLLAEQQVAQLIYDMTGTAVTAICAICHNFAYCVPIAYKHIYGTFNRGPWHMGRASLAVDIVSLVGLPFCPWSCSFRIRSVTPQNVGIIYFFYRSAVSRDNSSPRKSPVFLVSLYRVFRHGLGKACFFHWEHNANSAPFLADELCLAHHRELPDYFHRILVLPRPI